MYNVSPRTEEICKVCQMAEKFLNLFYNDFKTNQKINHDHKIFFKECFINRNEEDVVYFRKIWPDILIFNDRFSLVLHFVSENFLWKMFRSYKRLLIWHFEMSLIKMLSSYGLTIDHEGRQILQCDLQPFRMKVKKVRQVIYHYQTYTKF